MNVISAKGGKVHKAAKWVSEGEAYPACREEGTYAPGFKLTEKAVSCMFCTDMVDETPAVSEHQDDAPAIEAAPEAAEYATREDWLNGAVEIFRDWFKDNAAYAKRYDGPIQVSVGWTSSGRRSKVAGECWAKSMSAGVSSIFVRPEIIANPVLTLATVLHEMIHAVDDCTNGHKGPFIQMARSFGFVKPFTEVAINAELHQRLTAMAADMGAMPGEEVRKPSQIAFLDRYGKSFPISDEDGKVISQPEAPEAPAPTGETDGESEADDEPRTSARRTQTTRMLKVQCQGEGCECGGYITRTTAKWVAIGLPFCPAGTQMELAA
ncbi:hypothetical protein [Microtetraspora malaysiensis]|uniref:hypothetical protein n=1 Tax=Microtetraspora malaysiensis TaxID=161358 RepID=UPI003D8B6716